MSQEKNDDLEFEVQTAAHDMDMESRLNADDADGDDNDEQDARIDIDYRNEVVFERFAKDIYQSAEAGIREPLSNAITACVRAKEEYGVENPTIEITLKHSAGGEKALQLRDNGVGMSYELIEEVLSTIGNSTSRDEGNKTGKFGMGFLACYMLTGTGGSFEMHTHSREPRKGPVSGIWRPGFFEVDKDNKLVGSMDDDEYGTKFIFPLDESIAVNDVRQWIRKHAEWSRVPIVYKEIENGSVVDDDEFGNRHLEDSYDENKPVLKVENEHFKACASPDARGRVILLDSPIRGSTGRMNNLPRSWDVDVRLKNENGVIIEGPNEGLAPISERDYTARPPERQEGFIKEKDVQRADIRLPEPTGTRDVLGNRPDFWSHLNDELGDQYAEEMRDLLESINSVDDFLNLETYEREMFSSDVMGTDAERMRRRCTSQFDYSMDEDLSKRLSALAENVEVVHHGADVNNLGYSDTSHKAVWELLNEVGDDGDVYLAVTMNDVKAQVVWAESENNRIVKLESASEYEDYEELDWSKLKDIRSTTIDEYDVPEEIKAPFKSDSEDSERAYSNPNAGRDAPDRELTVHTRSYRNTSKMTVSDIEDELVEAKEEGRSPSLDGRCTTLVLFPSGTDRKLSENEWVCSRGVGMANSTQMVYDYLSEYDGVYHIDEFIEGIDGISLTTSAGTYTFDEIMEEGDIGVVLHPMNSSSLPWFRGEKDPNMEMMKRVSDVIASHDKYESLRNMFPDDTAGLVYAPVLPETADRLRPKIRDNKRVVVGKGSYRYRTESEVRSKKLYGRDFALYARARLPKFDGTPEFAELLRRSTGFNERSLQMLSLFKQKHDDSDESPLSSEKDDVSLLTENSLTIDTDRGKMTLSDAVEADEEVVFHVVSPEVRDWFVDDEEYMKGTARFIVDNAEENTYRGRQAFDSSTDASDVIYAPITPSTMDEVSSNVDSPTYVVGDERDVWNGGNEISKDIRAFVSGRFPKWDGEDFHSLLGNMNKTMTDEEALHTLRTLIDFHDSGLSPESVEV